MKPYISIICPTMRIGGFDTIFNSLENQTFKDFELIISDSLYHYRKDIVKEQASKYSFRYKHIAPINDRFPICSICNASNSAIVQAEGDVILFTTDYRYFMPWNLQRHADFHKSHADNIGYAPPSKFILPPPTKNGLPSYGKNALFQEYMDDLNSNKLQEYMWSIFADDIFQIPQDLASWKETDRLTLGYDPKVDILPGVETTPLHIYLQSESIKTNIVLAANGMNEDLDGAPNYMDIEFSYRLRNLFDFKWIGDNTNPVYRIEGGHQIIHKSKLIEEIQNKAESIFKKYENGSKDPVNTWSLSDMHKSNTNTASPPIMQTKIEKKTMEYFGKSFKIIGWPAGNNGVDNPWDDEEPIRQKYWNSFTPGQVVIDIGACFGLYALPALMQGCRVIAFEPNVEHVDLMTKSVVMNGYEDRYQCYYECIWNNTPFPEELAKPVLGWCKQDKLSLTTLDDITKHLDRVDMIKMDVEGAEAGVMEGAEETIKKFRPSFLIEDHTGLFSYPDTHNTRGVIVSILQRHNYTIKTELFGGPPPPGGGRWFIIATPNNVDDKSIKLNLGSGINNSDALNIITSNQTGWKNIDICEAYKAHEHYDITTGIRETDNSIEEVWMGDFFEHLLRLKAKFVIEECFRVLKKGGRIRMSLPDMAIVMPLWLKANGDHKDHAMLIWGDQDEMHQQNSIPSAHLYGYTEYSLKKLLASVGFSKINRIGIHNNWCELAVEAYK